jgi:hypothetical protein
MHSGWKSVQAVIALTMFSVISTACQQDDGATLTGPSSMSPNAQVVAAGNVNGSAGQQPTFYDDVLFTVNMKELSEQASASVIAHNKSMNTIYATDDLDDPQTFFPVIDAIQGDGFNPLWRQVLITWNAGFTPHQFTSEEDVLAAAAGPNPEITLVPTDEVYRCSVVGSK